jgi:glycosyltransferase involved in cell wall biosynthesis
MPDGSAPRGHRIVVATISRSGFDGIADYCDHLVESLGVRSDVRVRLANPKTESIAQLVSGASSDRAAVTILLQYNPFNFGRWGFAPWLPAKLWRLKRQRPRPRIVLMVHETYVSPSDWRTALMGAWQRVQFTSVHALCDVSFASITVWARMLQRRLPRRPVHHLPVGSNMPDLRQQRMVMRARLDAEPQTLVLATFGTPHPSRLMAYVVDAAEAVARDGRPTMLLNLGSNVPSLDTIANVCVVAPGALKGEEVSRHLAAADIYLAPFADGVSTRRTTVMAALQHGLPVVGTDGPFTDPMLRDPAGGLVLVPVGDRAGFARAARALAVDDAARSKQSAQARALYERHFQWPVISSRLVQCLNGDGRRSS